MNLNIKKAFLSPFSEEKWYLKLIFPIIMAACNLISTRGLHVPESTVMIVSLISLVPSIILSGFFLQFEHNEIHDELPLLPVLNSKVNQYLIYGLNILGIALIYAFFMLLLFVIWALFVKLSGPFAIIIGIVVILAILYLCIVLGLALSSYADEFKFKDSMSFKRINKLLAKAPAEIFIYILVATGLVILASIFNIILLMAKFTFILAPIYMAIIQLTLVDLKAQVYKVAKSRLVICE